MAFVLGHYNTEKYFSQNISGPNSKAPVQTPLCPWLTLLLTFSSFTYNTQYIHTQQQHSMSFLTRNHQSNAAFGQVVKMRHILIIILDFFQRRMG